MCSEGEGEFLHHACVCGRICLTAALDIAQCSKAMFATA